MEAEAPAPTRFRIDAQLTPQLAPWLAARFAVEVKAVRDLSLRDAEDVEMVRRRGAPPQEVWLTCGNTSNARLREIMEATFPPALLLLKTGEPLVEIRDVAPTP